MDTPSELAQMAYEDDIALGIPESEAGIKLDLSQLCPACCGLGGDHVFIPEPLDLEEAI